MLLNLAKRNGKLLALEVETATDLNKQLNLGLTSGTIEKIRSKCSSETEVVESILEERYPNQPVCVHYDEAATIIRIFIFEPLPAPRILETIEGGIVQWAMATGPVEVLRLDIDEDAQDDPKEVSWTDIDGKKSRAVPGHEYVNGKDRNFVERVYNEVLKQI